MNIEISILLIVKSGIVNQTQIVRLSGVDGTEALVSLYEAGLIDIFESSEVRVSPLGEKIANLLCAGDSHAMDRNLIGEFLAKESV